MVGIGTPLMWSLFAAFVLVALLVDFFALNKQGAHRVSMKEAAVWSLIWVGVSFVFVGWLWWYLGGLDGNAVAHTKALEFVTGYLVEKALAVDNIFVFLMVFTYFAVPAEFQKRVLMIGILGALVLRAAMILVGAWLIAQFHWILYLFGAFLVFTAWRMLVSKDDPENIGESPVIRWVRRFFPVTPTYHEQHFSIIQNGRRVLTPLAVALVLVETTDLVFAVDSIPAIFAITTDPFIVFTSNVFAILGLRSLYFALAGAIDKFRYLKVSLAAILGVVGIKMLVADLLKEYIGPNFNFYLLGLVALILGAGVVASIIAARRDERRDEGVLTD